MLLVLFSFFFCLHFCYTYLKHTKQTVDWRKKKCAREREKEMKNNVIWIYFKYEWFWHFNKLCIINVLNWFWFSHEIIKNQIRLSGFSEVNWILWTYFWCTIKMVHWSFIEYIAFIDATQSLNANLNRSLILVICPTSILHWIYKNKSYIPRTATSEFTIIHSCYR